MTSPLIIEPLPAFTDNYIWALRRAGERDAWVVDPGDAQPVQTWLKANELNLAGILITHHHRDHVGGVAELVQSTTEVIGPATDPFASTRTPVADGDRVTVLNESFEVLDIPGHTHNHVGYFALPANEPPLLFCGDTLFSAGCGRLLGGTAGQLHRSLARIARLPAETRIYCTHEYTLANIQFALAVEPDNPALARRLEQARAQRQREAPTLPVSLGTELAYNPFLRCALPSVQQAVEEHDGLPVNSSAEAFARLRDWKDVFRPARKIE